MKKFEIVNRRWIQNLDVNKEDEVSFFVKLSSVSILTSGRFVEFADSKDYYYGINLSSSESILLEIKYSVTEKELWKLDLRYLQDLLFQIA